MEIKEQGMEIKEPRIEVRELRIGNSVLFGEEIVKIAGISPTGLLDGKQYVTIVLHGGNLMMVDILKIKGVALSEKLLEEYKFGVCKGNGPSEQDWYWVKHGFPFAIWNKTWRIHRPSKKIEYLHQLQNLLFDFDKK